MVEDDKKIIARLNVVVSLLLDLLNLLTAKHKERIPEKIMMSRLKQFGLNNQEIALFFGKSSKEVTKQIYEAKRKRKRLNK